MDFSASFLFLFLFLCFLLSCFFVLTAHRSRRRPAGTSVLPPGPPGFPVIGNILDVGKSPHRSLAELSKTYGPVMSLKLGTVTTVVVSSREAAKQVLQTHDHVLSARTFNFALRSFDHHDVSIVWLPPAAPWRLLRKISANQLFSPQRLEATKSVRMNKVKELLNFVSELSERGEAVDIARASFVTVLNIVSNALFSVDFAGHDSHASDDYRDTVIRVMEVVGKPDITDFFPFLGFLDLQGTRKEARDCTGKLFEVFQRFIDARTRERSHQTEPKDVSDTDLLDALLDLTRENEAELSMKSIQHLLLDLFGAGTDTNSSTVEWAMAELLRNPNTMERVQAEIRRVIGENGVVQESDIAKLPYLQAVVKETFRLHPAAPLLIPRKAESDVQILGFLVPKNAQVLLDTAELKIKHHFKS